MVYRAKLTQQTFFCGVPPASTVGENLNGLVLQRDSAQRRTSTWDTGTRRGTRAESMSWNRGCHGKTVGKSLMKWGCSLISIAHFMGKWWQTGISNDFGLSEKPRWGPQDRCLVGFRTLGDTLHGAKKKACKRVWGDTLPSSKTLQPWRSEEEGSFFFNGARAVLQLSK